MFQIPDLRLKPPTSLNNTTIKKTNARLSVLLTIKLKIKSAISEI
jgi:hypothetical protein